MSESGPWARSTLHSDAHQEGLLRIRSGVDDRFVSLGYLRRSVLVWLRLVYVATLTRQKWAAVRFTLLWLVWQPPTFESAKPLFDAVVRRGERAKRFDIEELRAWASGK